jgi:hypothetical protein
MLYTKICCSIYVSHFCIGAEEMLAERSTDHDSETESNNSHDQSISEDDYIIGQISTDDSNENGGSDGEHKQ